MSHWFTHLPPLGCRGRFLCLGSWLLVISLAQVGQADMHESFESATPTWRLAERDCGLRLSDKDHRRAFGGAHSGHGFEQLRYLIGPGSYAYLVHDILPTRMIDELSMSVWIRCNHPGIQLMARVVLPRSIDQETGKPDVTLIYGTSYQQVGVWQQLRIENPEKKLAEQVFSAREKKRFVDTAEAYIDLVVINMYGKEGATELSIDDLDVTNQVLRRAPEDALAANARPTGQRQVNVPSVVRGGLLYVAERPLALRAVDFNGESFAFLATLGFNTVVLNQPPTERQIAAAAEQGLWLITPAPLGEPQPPPDRVIAWIVGEQLGRREVDVVRQRVQMLRRALRHECPPLIAGVGSHLSVYSQFVDLVLLDRRPLGSSLQLSEYSRWLAVQAEHLQLGVSFWASVQTEPDLRVAGQINGFGGSEEALWMNSPDQIQQIAIRAAAAGARGHWFRSRRSLETRDPATRQRALGLHRLCLDLQLYEPWIAGGESKGPLATGDRTVFAATLATERSRLILVTRQAENDQFALAPTADAPVSFAVHGAPVTDDAYEFRVRGLHRLLHQRGTGLRVTLSDPRPVTAIVVTQDAYALRHAARLLNQQRQPRAQIEGELVQQEFAWTELMQRRLNEFIQTQSFGTDLSRIRTEMRYLDQLLSSGGGHAAFDVAHRIKNELRRFRRQAWEVATAAFPTPVSSPCCVSFATLPLHWMTARRLLNATWSTNLLPGGDFESLEHLQTTGWTYDAYQDRRVGSSVTLSYDGPRSGRATLQIQATDQSGYNKPPADAPVKITSAPIPVQQGQLVRIEGWIKVDKKINGSLDGFRIYDSLGSEALAVSFDDPSGWQPFVLYRVATEDEAMTVNIELSGYGSVVVDDFSVKLLQP